MLTDPHLLQFRLRRFGHADGVDCRCLAVSNRNVARIVRDSRMQLLQMPTGSFLQKRLYHHWYLVKGTRFRENFLNEFVVEL